MHAHTYIKKMVWVPFWFLLVVGAILEGVLHYTENEVFTKRSFPIGGGIGICVAMGLLISLGLMQVHLPFALDCRPLYLLALSLLCPMVCAS